MIGLYPDCPGSPYYALTTPVFDKITLHLDKRYYPNGDLVIEAPHPSPEAYLIQKMTLGDKSLNRYRISHDELINGQTLKFVLNQKD